MKRYVIGDKNLSKSKLMEILNKTIPEASKILNISSSSISRLRKENNINLTHAKRSFPNLTELTEGEKSIIVGMLLGDSCLSKGGNNRLLNTSHCKKQKEYMYHKMKLLHRIGGKCHEYSTLDKRTNKTYNRIIWTSKSNIFLNNIYNKIYINGIKEVSMDILNMLNPESIAIWFMDDGSYYSKNGTNHLVISTNGFNRNSINNIINYFKLNYNLNFKATKQGAIRLTSIIEINKFMDNFEKYIINSMKYKCPRQNFKSRYCIGDIHGNLKALRQVLDKSKFDYKKDFLIIIGDVVDGYNCSYGVVEELLKIKNSIFIIGNHDMWFMEHMANGWAENIWLSQGGENTRESYKSNGYYYNKFPDTHKEFFNNGVFYYELDNMLFIHGGFEYPIHPKDSKPDILTWDRTLIERFKNGLKVPEWDKIFVGHTTTERQGSEPIAYDNGEGCAELIQVDCGAGWAGRLCLYNIDTDEYTLSDYAKELNGCDGR